MIKFIVSWIVSLLLAFILLFIAGVAARIWNWSFDPLAKDAPLWVILLCSVCASFIVVGVVYL